MSTPLSANPFRESRLNSDQDYRPEWDVLSLNERAVRALIEEIRQAEGRDKPNPQQLIPVILAAPGYGKTHLFGRVGHELGSEALFVYVPGIEDLTKPVEHICRYAVESLFRAPPGKPSFLGQALARLCQPSFLEYIKGFPPSVAARFQGLVLGFQDSPDKAQEVVTAVKDLAPFLRLAASIADRLCIPHVPRDVIQALALGWSPAAHLVRRWLKGESLPVDDQQRLGLGEESPQPLDVLQGISAILQYRVPVVLCCDQLEFLTTASKDLTNQVTARLMGILEKVPNQVLILSCLQAEWQTLKDKAFQSFLQRVRQPEIRLDPLREQQALDLVANRLKSWEGRHPSGTGPAWPFDESALFTYVQQKRPTPRALIQNCARLFGEWLEAGGQGLIYLGDRPDGPDPAREFLLLWNGELEKIRNDSTCEPEEYPEDRLYRAVREALNIARESFRDLGGVRVKNIQEDVIKQGGKDRRYALAVDVATPTASGEVLLLVTVLDNSNKFRFYFDALRERLTPAVAGTLIVHRHAEFEMGPKTRAAFDTAVGAGQVRVFALEENPQTLERLECLLRFLDRTVGQEMVIAGKTLSVKDCVAYVLETAVLANLDLFRALGAWRKLQAPRKVPVSPGGEGALAAVAAASGVAAGSGGDTGASAAGASPPPPPPPQPPPVPPPTSGPVAGSQAPTPEPEPESAPPLGNQAFQAKYEAWAREKQDLLVKRLTLWGQPVEPDGVEVGPAFARLQVIPGPKTFTNRIRDKAEALKTHLELDVEPVIDSQGRYISVDVQLPERRTVTLGEALADSSGVAPDAPAFPAGVDVAGKAHWLDLSDTSDCHLLVAGQTGSGKSEFLRAMIAALAHRLSPEQFQLVLIDPKRVTFNLGALESPYLKFPIVLDTEGALPLLQWCLEETRRRYDLLARQKKSNISQLEDATLVPRIVVVIDEFANLLEDKQAKPVLTSLLKQIGAMSRAAGIHLVLATQRPDKDVVTPLLRDNLPGRVAFQVKTPASSKLIIPPSPNAAYLLGKGDLLWQRGGGLLRLQSPFVTQPELEKALRAR